MKVRKFLSNADRRHRLGTLLGILGACITGAYLFIRFITPTFFTEYHFSLLYLILGIALLWASEWLLYTSETVSHARKDWSKKGVGGLELAMLIMLLLVHFGLIHIK